MVSMSAAYSITVTLVHYCACIECGVPIFGPEVRRDELKRSHSNFFCINGHPQHWPGESTEEKLRRELADAAKATERAKKEKEWAEQEAKAARHAKAIAEGKMKAQSERVKNGVCPCCNRSFTNLRRHMSTKHPGCTP